MKSTGKFAVTLFSLLIALSSQAARIDMDDPRRAVGRESDIRVDAQLLQEEVSPGSSLGATVQIQNLSDRFIAVAEKVSATSYDAETRTITLSVGAEIPDKHFPMLTVIAPGAKTTFGTGGLMRVNVLDRGAFTALPRYVQIRVNVIRDIEPFRQIIARQSPATRAAISAHMFDLWIDSNESIFLNSIPIRWVPGRKLNSAEERLPAGGFRPPRGTRGGF